MNNKGPWTVVIMVIILSGLFIGVMVWGINEGFKQDKTKESCENDGMKWNYGDDFDYCIDSDGNANSVTFDCEGLFWNMKCDYRIINMEGV